MRGSFNSASIYRPTLPSHLLLPSRIQAKPSDPFLIVTPLKYCDAGNELLELAANFLYDFPEDLKDAVLENYLVNPSGLPGHWHELDLLQEHYTYWIKRLFNSKSHDFDSKHLSEAVGLNIAGFSALRDRIPAVFGYRRNGKKHTDPNKDSDINRLGAHYREASILSRLPDRPQPYQVENEFASGMDTLSTGALNKFIKRTTTATDGTLDEEEEEEEEEVSTTDGVTPESDSDRLPAILASFFTLTSSRTGHLDISTTCA